MWKRIPLGCKVLLGLALVIIPLLCGLCLYVSFPDKHTKDLQESGPPPPAFSESDLVGTWEAKYCSSRCVDRLILRPDGTFKQIYRDTWEEEYLYETPWNKWWIERFPDGRVYVHLEGARYYPDGIEVAEEQGIAFGKPWGYHDPFDPEKGFGFVEMAGKLVLNVRALRSGEIVLVHMWSSSESPSWDAFYRVEESPQQGTEVP